MTATGAVSRCFRWRRYVSGQIARFAEALPPLSGPECKRPGITAIIRAGFVRTGFSFNQFGLRMEGNKPFLQLGAKNGEGRHAAKCRQVPRPGIVAQENADAVNERKQRRDAARADDFGLAIFFPPVFLVGIAGNLNGVIFLPQMKRQPLPVLQWPYPGGQARAAVDQNRLLLFARRRD